MNKKFLFLFVFCLLPLAAFSAEIERYCFKDTDGSIYDFRGGSLGKKAYTVKVTNVFCASTPLAGMATFAKLNNGYEVTALVPRPVGNPFCDFFVISGLVNFNLQSITGNIDYIPRNSTPDEPFFATRVMCNPEL